MYHRRRERRKLETITRQYFAAVTGVDEQFGRILQYLKDNHLEEDTLVVLSADHGELLGSHGRESKNVWYEESIHIPLYIRQKGHLAPGRYPGAFCKPGPHAHPFGTSGPSGAGYLSGL